MKVRTYIELADEVEINIDPAEILRELPGCYPTGDESISAIQQMVSRCVRCLMAISDETVSLFTPAAKEITAQALREQAARFTAKAEGE